MTENTINDDMTMGGPNGTLLVGRYRVVRQLGQGGMGSVWLAEDEKLDGFKVAIKMLPSVLVNNKRAYQQVKAEALVSLKLSHPNIATVRAFEEESGSPFLVMDYIDGQTLDDYLAEKGKLSEDETIRLLKPVAAALDYAHTQGVVHRDVKPGNVMIRKDGTAFVLDFGIAREIQETMTRVTGKLSSGTLLYMSPEQLNGDAPKPAQDIYSFAAMAYECLTGSPPFVRGGIEDQIKHKTPDSLPVHIAICRGVMTGLEKEATRRPRTCTEVLVMKVEQPKSESPRLQPLASATMSVPEQDMRFLPPGERRWFDNLPRYENCVAEESGSAQRECADSRDYRPASNAKKQSSSGVSYGWLAVIAVVLSAIAIWFNWPKDRSEDSGKRGTMSTDDVREPEPLPKPIEQEVPSVFVTAEKTPIRALPGKWACSTTLSGGNWTSVMKYEYVFNGDGSYTSTLIGDVVIGKGGKTTVIERGNWLLAKDRLTLRPDAFSVNNGPSNSYKSARAYNYNLLWNEEGAFELRQAEIEHSFKNGQVTTYQYDVQGREIRRTKSGDGGMSTHIETAKVFRRVPIGVEDTVRAGE